MKPVSICVLALALALLARSASAHHSMAIYEVFPTTMEGTVEEFKFTNPHSIIVLRANGANWYLEGEAPAVLDHDGYPRNLLRAGDKIKLMVHKLRSGQPGGMWSVHTILEQNGHEFVGHQCMTSPDHCNGVNN
jgi:hypothetical protein